MTNTQLTSNSAGEKLKDQEKTGMCTFTTLRQHGTSHSNQTRNRSKRHSDRKEQIKLSLFTSDMLLCIDNHKDSTQNLKLINEFS